MRNRLYVVNLLLPNNYPCIILHLLPEQTETQQTGAEEHED